MSRSAPQRMSRFSLEATFEQFWAEHVNAVSGRGVSEELVTAPLPSPARA